MIRALILAAGIGAMMALSIPGAHRTVVTRNYVIDASVEEIVGPVPSGATIHTY